MASVSVIQHRKESNFNSFAKLLASMESRYKNIDDGVIDINSMEIVRTRSGRVSRPPKNNQNSNSFKKGGQRSKPSLLSSLSSTPLSSPSPSPSNVPNDSSGYGSATSLFSSPDSSVNLEINSILYDRGAQNLASKKMLSILKAGGPLADTAWKNLHERSLAAVGWEKLPNHRNARPFFTFNENNEIGVTFLFYTPDLTPWTLICLAYFGEENLEIYQEMYSVILKREVSKQSQADCNFPSKLFTSTPNKSKLSKPSLTNAVAIREQDKLANIQGNKSRYHNMNVSKIPFNTHSINSHESSSKKSSDSKSYFPNKPLYHPQVESLVYQNDKQLSFLRQLVEILRQNDEESTTTKRKLRERAALVLGSDLMPYGRTVTPFFTFHEKGEIGVSFLFDQTLLSPWANICKVYFGNEILTLCKEIYKLINQPHINSLDELKRLSTCSKASANPSLTGSRQIIKQPMIASSNQLATMDSPLTQLQNTGSRNTVSNDKEYNTRARTSLRTRSSPIEISQGARKRVCLPLALPVPLTSNSVSRALETECSTRLKRSKKHVLLDFGDGDESSDEFEELLTPRKRRKTRNTTQLNQTSKDLTLLPSKRKSLTGARRIRGSLV